MAADARPGEELQLLLDVATEAAAAAAATALSWRDRADALSVEEKQGSDDLVSQADRDAEREARDVLTRRRPRDGVVGEELHDVAGETGVVWVIDPIDGTTNYLYGRASWAVSVAALSAREQEVLVGVVVEPAVGGTTAARHGGGCFSNGQPATCTGTSLDRALVELNTGLPEQRGSAGAVVDALVPAVRDVRRGGSAAAALAQVATGRADAYWGPGLQPYDAAAGLLLVAEAGGAVGDLDARTSATWPASGNVLASSVDIWQPLRALIRDVF